MAKDPAFLFYSSDFLTGTIDLTVEEKGQYIMLMCMQHQKGHLSEKTIRLTLGSVSVDVLAKFKKDENGLLFNERLEDEINKRTEFVESRRNNGKLGGRPKKPSAKPNGKAKDNLPENEIENIIDYLNKKVGSKFKASTKSTIRSINGRIEEGHTVDDFKKVIDIKHSEWEGTEWEKYLNPDTLFRPSNFEKYLNQKEVERDLF